MDRREALGALAAGAAGLGLSGALGAAQPAAKPAPQPPVPQNPREDYPVHPFAFPEGLPGLSKGLLAEHLGLYRGYVTRTNALLHALQAREKDPRPTPEAQELRRRLGFEFSGMRLHELYFEALRNGAPGLERNHPLHKAMVAQWGSFEGWLASFRQTALMPGIGWAALVKDPLTGRLMNAWFQDHENAIPVGTVPILVADVWEHAYVGDYAASGRAKYLDALLPLLDWNVIARRF
jgi:Fe-Mn family superoxide dismutase